MGRRILVCAVLGLLLAVPAGAATEIARCHARQLKAVAGLGRAQLACFAEHVKRRDVDPGSDVLACRAKAEARFLERYERASRARRAIGTRCVLASDGAELAPSIAGFAEAVRDDVLAESDPLDAERNAQLAKLLKQVGRLFDGALAARARDAARPDAAALARKQARLEDAFLSASQRLLAKARGAPRDPSPSALVARVEDAEAPLAASAWYAVEGNSTWSGCFDPALNGTHFFTGTTVIETPGADVFAGFYEVQSGSFVESGTVSEGVGSLAAGSFSIAYLDFASGTFYVAGTSACTSQSAPGEPEVFLVDCVAADSVGLTCASKLNQGVVSR